MICNRCVIDDTVPLVEFDEDGICNYCHEHDENEKLFPISANLFQTKIDQIMKQKGKYNCILGLSGGCDSSYLLHLAIENGLKPYIIHFDNGWNAQVAVENIHNLAKKLNVEVHKVKPPNMKVFYEVQKAFLHASVPDAEVPTDIAIKKTLYYEAVKHKIKYILSGANFRTEGRVPRPWSFVDGRYLKSVYEAYAFKKLKDFPNMTLYDHAYYSFIKKLKAVKLLNYVRYIKSEVKELLKSKYNWQDYGGKHYESEYTKFVSAWWCPNKFGIDKRKIEFAALVRSGQMSRELAFGELEMSPTEFCEDVDVKATCDKLEISQEQFQRILKQPNRNYSEFPNYSNITNKVKPIIKRLPRL